MVDCLSSRPLDRRAISSLPVGRSLQKLLGIHASHTTPPTSEETQTIRGADVPLTHKEREVALLSCSEDWNCEVVYWLLNFWEKNEPFKPQDVREGNIPFGNKRKFEGMNRVMCHMGKILGEERLPSEKAMRKNFSVQSIKQVMVNMGNSYWHKFSQEDKNILGRTFLDYIDCRSRYLSEGEEWSKVNWFQEFASQEDTSDAIWNFLWYMVSSKSLSVLVNYRILPSALEQWKNEGRQTRSQRDFFISTAIVLHLSQCVDTELQRSFWETCKDATGDDCENSSRNITTVINK